MPTVQLLLSALCLLVAVAAVVRAIRAPSGLTVSVAAGVTLWALGDAWFTVMVARQDPTPFPSVADGFWLCSYLPLYAALMFAIRERVADWDTGLWLDGLVAALTMVGVGEAIVLPLLTDAGQSLAPVADVMAYTLADLLLIGVVAGGLATTRGRLRGRWALLLGGVLVLTFTDSVFLLRVAEGTYDIGHPVDLGWAAALGLLTLGAWHGDGAGARPVLRGRRLPLVPLACSSVAVVLLLVDHFAPLGDLTVLAASAAILLGVARTALTLRANLRLRDSERQANTDDLTGLANRRSLLRDLEEAVSAPGGATLALFDLDGFKAYNDAYGHLAGDALLAALGRELARSVACEGTAYRLGGDEFCLLVRTDRVEHRLVLDRALAALRQEGGGFAVSCSYGTVAVPAEAATPSQALQLADTRMYAQKDARRASTRHQSRDLLLQILHEQQPDLEEHSGDVGALVSAVGRRLGLSDEELDHARDAAQLHDVGKVAVPPAILTKPGPLDDDEWRLMQRHTVIGERILSAVPALVPVGRIVRASHERWDGGGYPDGLAGAAIPLPARIIAVCDSFHAITTDRPYRAGRSEAEAVAELRRCAGTQFDPAVVDAFAAVLAAGVPAADTAPCADRSPAALAVDGRAVDPARAVAGAAAGELATLTGMQGLLNVARTARETGDVDALLDEVCRTVACSLGFRTVVVNLVRPAWDDTVVTAVAGGEDVRQALLGTAERLSTWGPLLDERFARAGAYFVPEGSIEWGIESHVPDLPPTDDPAAWHAGDGLFVPLRSTEGELLGLVSVDEPVWGLRPSDDQLEVLAAVAGHAAVTLEHARDVQRSAARDRGAEQVLALSTQVLRATTADDVLAAVAAAVRDGLGFGCTGHALLDDPAARDAVERLVLGASAWHGVCVLDGEAAQRARAWCGRAGAVEQGRGPLAWAGHLVVLPLRDADGILLGVVWADDPADRLVPRKPALRIAAAMGAQAAIALSRSERAAAVA